ncbi:MAG: FtsX-like permease family protein, partial [Prolixibacteraceae bacterium]|nr:FtsX-like permease family protein [Prolixibacteraceae bacterium]
VNGNVKDALSSIEKVWKDYYKGYPFRYEFLDQLYGRFYEKEIKLSAMFKVFTSIAIILSALGILGLAFFDSQLKIKEIGIRKVNGANIFKVMFHLNQNYAKWVFIAFVLAAPVSYYIMNRWLENFAYKTTLSWWIFALAGILALGIALLTVSWQSWRAATRNPVEALRYE